MEFEWWEIALTYLMQITDLLDSFSSATGDLMSIVALIKDIWAIVVVAAGAIATVVGVAAVIFCIVAYAIFLFIHFIIPAIALAVQGKKAGYKFWWLAFIPIGQIYVMFVLPRENFKLAFVNTRKRFIPCIVYTLLLILEFPIALVCLYLNVFGLLIILAMVVVIVALKWRMIYDLMYMYYKKDSATVVSIVGTAIPLVFFIGLIINMFKEPKFGYGNYYNNSWVAAGETSGAGEATEVKEEVIEEVKVETENVQTAETTEN